MTATAALPEAIQATYERLLATLPALTADLSCTVADLRAAIDADRLCESGVQRALRQLGMQAEGDRISVQDALSAGIDMDDVLYALKIVPDADPALRLFAADCAEMVLPLFETDYPDDLRPRQAIQAARDFALGVITAEELDAAWDAARAAARDAARDAAWAAAWDAAWDAARDACGQLLRRYHAQREVAQAVVS